MRYIVRAVSVADEGATMSHRERLEGTSAQTEHVDSHHAHAAPVDQHHGHGDQSGREHHDKHAGHGDGSMFRDKFWISLVVAIPVVYFSEMVGDLFGYSPPDWGAWIPPVLGTFLYFYGGRPFLTGAVAELRNRQPGMMTLIGLAISVAFVASALTTLGVGDFDLDFWWELALLIVIMLLGHWLEMRALGQASGALAALAELLPDTADRVDADGGIVEVPLAELKVGDLVLVRSGARVPADGVVSEGAAEVDESTVTGESATVLRAGGDRVVAGTVATDSSIRVEVTAVGEDTALAGIHRVVADAQASSSRAQALADRAAGWLFWFALFVAAVTFVVWMLLDDSSAAVERAVTVLVIACPHALGLAIPLVIAISTSMSAKAGILVKDRLALERMRQVDAVLFDKTGTLTRGRPVVNDIAALPGSGGEDEVLRLAAGAEHDSEHPLAQAIVLAAAERGEVPAATDFQSRTGRGVQAVVEGAEVAVGGPALIREDRVEVPTELEDRVQAWSGRGATVLYVLRDSVVVGALALSDEIRPESRQAVDQLHAEGVRVVMITGDARPVAEAVAADLGIDEVFAEVLPADKDSAVIDLQKRGHTVAMVGDGVNDAPALARADVGIAIGAGTDVAIESAGVVLISDDPRGVVSTIRLSQASYRKMIQNLVWATGYNVVAIPLAAGVLAPIGFVLPPAAAAIAMTASTIIVAFNAQLLRRLNLRPR